MRYFVKVAIAAVLLIGTACSAATSSSSAPAGSGKVSSGLGSQDATGDVRIGRCHDGGAYLHEAVDCGLTITNHSGGTSDYYVEAQAFKGSTIVGTLINASASSVPAGATAKVKLSGIADGRWDRVTITQIQRTASA